MDQPIPSSGDITTSTGRWTEGGLRVLAPVAADDLDFAKGPIGWSVHKNRVHVGRINRPLAGKGKVFVVRVTGHEFWAPPSRVIPSWHYTPVASAPSLAKAKALIRFVLGVRPNISN